MITKQCPWCENKNIFVFEVARPAIIKCSECGKTWADTQRSLNNIALFVEAIKRQPLEYDEAEQLYQGELPFDLSVSREECGCGTAHAETDKIVVEILAGFEGGQVVMFFQSAPSTLEELQKQDWIVTLRLTEKATKRVYEY